MSRLAASLVLLRKKQKSSPRTIKALFGLIDWAGGEIAKAWDKKVGAAVKQTRSRQIRTEAQVKAEMRRLDAVARAFGRDDALAKLILELARDAYAIGSTYILDRDAEVRKRRKMPPLNRANLKKAKPTGVSQIVAGFDFELADSEALEALEKQALIWFRDIDGLGYSSTAAREAILERAERQIAEGVSGIEVAASLADAAEELYGVGRFAPRGLNYWAGVSDNAAVHAAVRGSLTQLAAIGWTRYEIVNPMDERTTPMCAMLNGKTLLVSDAMAAMEAVDRAATIEAVKEAKPFVSGGRVPPSASGLSTGATNLSPARSGELAQAGFAVPPYHFRCRSFIDIAIVEGDSVPTP